MVSLADIFLTCTGCKDVVRLEHMQVGGPGGRRAGPSGLGGAAQRGAARSSCWLGAVAVQQSLGCIQQAAESRLPLRVPGAQGSPQPHPMPAAARPCQAALQAMKNNAIVANMGHYPAGEIQVSG